MSFELTATIALGRRALRLIEWYTRFDEDTLLYEYTIDDPTICTRPSTVMIPLKKRSKPIFEYACHEGNYGMIHILSARRAQGDKECGER